MTILHIGIAFFTDENEALATDLPVVLNNLICTHVHRFMSAALHVASKLLVAVMSIQVRLLVRISVFLITLINIAPEFHTCQLVCQ